MPDWKEGMPNRQGARLVKVMEPRMGILPDLQSRRDGVVYWGIYTNSYAKI